MTAAGVARRIHPFAGGLALLTMLLFWTSTVAVELLGDPDAIVTVKHLIVWGLLVLVPALAATGGTGFALGGRSAHPLIRAKKRRMLVAAAVGFLVLVPCVLYLGFSAAPDDLGAGFVVVQGVELLSGGVNITLMSLNARDGLRLTGRIRARAVGITAE